MGQMRGENLDTRFEVTKSRLNSVSFYVEMEMYSHDMEVVAPFSFDEDIHNKIGTNECNKCGKSEGDLTKGEEKALADREDKEINKKSLSSKDKVESGVYVPSRPPKKPGEKDVDEMDTTANISRAPTITFGNTAQIITNLSKIRRCQILGV